MSRPLWWASSESTLASKPFLNLIKRARERGYEVELVYRGKTIETIEEGKWKSS
ncbi:MAG: hypothetical protein JNM76_03945 [Betaproteobacteria bacterium]|nr:hypothetical protein [Betaproteobacteria bacterium]